MPPSPAPTRMRVDQLRAELRARGLDVAGTKQILVARLQAAMAAGVGTGSESVPKPTSGPPADSSEPVPSAETPARSQHSIPVQKQTASTNSQAQPQASPQTGSQGTAARGQPNTPGSIEPQYSSVPATHSATNGGAFGGNAGTAAPGSSHEENGVRPAVSKISSEPSGAAAVLVAPEKMTMEERLAARARRFGIEPENNALLKRNENPIEASGPWKESGPLNGKNGKEALNAATGPASQVVKASVHAGKASGRRDQNRTGVSKRERTSEVPAAEVLTPEEEAMRAKRAKRFGLTTGSVAQS